MSGFGAERSKLKGKLHEHKKKKKRQSRYEKKKKKKEKKPKSVLTSSMDRLQEQQAHSPNHPFHHLGRPYHPHWFAKKHRKSMWLAIQLSKVINDKISQLIIVDNIVASTHKSRIGRVKVTTVS
jgi:hypothetical protein